LKRLTSKAKAKNSMPKVPNLKTSKKVSNPSHSKFDLDLVKHFTQFMKDHELVELDLSSGDQAIRLRRAEQFSSHSLNNSSVKNSTPIVIAEPSAAPKADRAATHSKDTHIVTSPFVGTFYRSQGPNQDPFVEEGQMVNAGDTVCIIEAMKLMNEIESDIKGRIVRVMVSNGTPVEFGEGLFEIERI